MRPKKKMSKQDSLKPILNMLETFLVSHGADRARAGATVLDIAERLLTAGYGWDKILQYHSKGEDIFLKKLIPHIYMSKDQFPPTMTPNDVLEKIFSFMEDWKSKLYDMISFNSFQMPGAPAALASPRAEVNIGLVSCHDLSSQQSYQAPVPLVRIKEEPTDDHLLAPPPSFPALGQLSVSPNRFVLSHVCVKS